MSNINDWKQANSDISFPQAGSGGVSRAALVTGAKSGQPTKFPWQDVRFALARGSIVNPGVFDHFLGNEGLATIPTPWRANLASTGTIAVVAGGALNGKLRLTTAATNNDFVTAALSLSFSPNQGFLYWESKVNLASIVTRANEFGVSDAMSESAGLAFSNHSVAGVTDVADNAAIFAFATTNGGANWLVNTVKAGTPQAVDTGVVVAAATDYVLGILIDINGDAQFFIDGDLVATVTDAVTPAALLTPWATNKALAGTATIADIDYIGIVESAA